MRPVPPPLTARLAKPEPVVRELPNVEPPVQPPSRPRLAAPAKVVPSPTLTPIPAPAERVPSVEPPKQAMETPVVATVAPVAPLPVAPPPAASGPDPGTVAQFRLELMDLARRYKKYPRIAQENNWEGRVELRIAIAENGAISSITVKKGAGRAVLDDEAQAMIRAAKSKATIPPGLRGRAFTLEIPVDFLLKE